MKTTRRQRLEKILGTHFTGDGVAVRVLHEAVERDMQLEGKKDREELVSAHRAEIAALKGTFNAELGAIMASFQARLTTVYSDAVRDALAGVAPLAERAEKLEKTIEGLEAITTTRNSKTDALLDRLRKDSGRLKEQFAEFAIGAPNRSFYMNGALPSVYFSDTNLIAGSGITLTASTDFVAATADITISATGGGGFTVLPATGVVNAVNPTFGFTQEPSYIVSDGAWYTPLDSNGGTQWTWDAGTSEATMVIPPQTSIFGVQ